MKQLLILSGKGGTGKTTVASAFIKLSKTKIFADCDVDAPNLHLLMMRESEPSRTDYYGMPKAVIDPSLCVSCGLCEEHCRFGAIDSHPNYHVNLFACEGCGVCAHQCPAKAIEMNAMIDGTLMRYHDHEKTFATASLKIGSGTSGKLVTAVKTQVNDAIKARYTANHFPNVVDADSEVAIIDGSPGIGCPVIASISGVDLVLVVAEPTLSGMSDMIRILETSKKMGTNTAVCVNKFDINNVIALEIEKYCDNNDIPYLGDIPFDDRISTLINEGKTAIDSANRAGDAIKRLYLKTMSYLDSMALPDSKVVKSITAFE
jgi:MinD superfamily P-loop ATPase